jgi:cell division protein YceG involved in septum cleavage
LLIFDTCLLCLVPQLNNSPQARKQLIEFMVKKNQGIVDETTRLENYARDNKSLKGYVPKIPIINLQSGSTKLPSQMSRQELINAIEEKKRQPQ